MTGLLGRSTDVPETASRTIFLSHTRADKDVARDLYHYLTARGIRAWLDEAEIQYGASILDTIADTINQIDYLAVLMSPASVTADWVSRELQLAAFAQQLDLKPQVLGILVEDCDAPAFLATRLYFDLRTDRSSEMERLAEFLSGRPRIVSQPLGSRFAAFVLNAGEGRWSYWSMGRASTLTRAEVATRLRMFDAAELEAAVEVARTCPYGATEIRARQAIARSGLTDPGLATRCLDRLVVAGVLMPPRETSDETPPVYEAGPLLWIIRRAAPRTGLFPGRPAARADAGERE